MELFILLSITFLINIPAGYFRENFKRMSWQWLLVLHSPIPLIVTLRLAFGFDFYIVPFLILTAIIGQLVGARPIRKYILANIKKSQDNKII